MKNSILAWFSKPSLQRVMTGLRYLMTVALCLTVWGFAQSALDHADTQAVRLLWQDNHGLNMLKDGDIYTMLGPVQHRAKLKVFELEQNLLKLPYISKAQVCYDTDNCLNIFLLYRAPILRALPEGTVGYYVSADGVGLPLKSDFAAPLPVLLGGIPQSPPQANQPLSKNISLALKAQERIQKDTLLEPLITQYFITGHDSNALILRTVRGQEIWVGTSNALDHKLTKLSTFYRLAPVDSAPESFRFLNLVFQNQIVCR